MILRKGITGFYDTKDFGNIRSTKNDEIKTILKKILHPYIPSNVIEPQSDNNYFSVNIQNKTNGLNFKLLINEIYCMIAGVTSESKWMKLEFIDLPNDFIEQINFDNGFMILNKKLLETEVPKEEIKILDKAEMDQINYWKSKTYGEIIFNGYD